MTPKRDADTCCGNDGCKLTPGDARHGTAAGYTARCRCDGCRAGQAAYIRRWRARNQDKAAELNRRHNDKRSAKRRADPNWTPRATVDVEAVVAMIREHLTAREIAAQLECSADSVRRIAAKHGLTVTSNKDRNVERVRQCAAQGMTAQATAKQTGLSLWWVYQLAKSEGVRFDRTGCRAENAN